MKKGLLLICLVTLLASFALLPVPAPDVVVPESYDYLWTPVQQWDGLASYYGPGYDGRKTASGAVFDQRQLTVAHRTLPFGTVLRLRNPKNGQATVVVVNDRGPYCNVTGRVKERYTCADGHDPREIDVSLGVAQVLGFEREGVALLEISRLSYER